MPTVGPLLAERELSPQVWKTDYTAITRKGAGGILTEYVTTMEDAAGKVYYRFWSAWLAPDIAAILAPPCVFHQRLSIQNMQGGIRMTVTSAPRSAVFSLGRIPEFDDAGVSQSVAAAIAPGLKAILTPPCIFH